MTKYRILNIKRVVLHSVPHHVVHDVLLNNVT